MINQRLIIFFFLIFTVSFCSSNKKENSSSKSMDFKREVELSANTQKQTFSFIPKEESDRYEVRLYFSSISFEDNEVLFGGLTEDIINSLEGLQVIINSDEENNTILNHTIDSEGDSGKYSFSLDDPLSMWIKSNVSLQKDTKYNIELLIPSIGKNSKVNNFAFVVRVASKAHL